MSDEKIYLKSKVVYHYNIQKIKLAFDILL